MIQGLSGSMTKLAGVLIREELMKAGIYDHAFIVNLVHDEIVIECRQDLTEQVCSIVKNAMEDAGKVFCKHVPMVANPVVSDYWRH